MKKNKLVKLLFLFLIAIASYITVGRIYNIPLTQIQQKEEIKKESIEDMIPKYEAEYFEFDNPPSYSNKNYFLYGKIILLEGEIVTALDLKDVDYFKFKDTTGDFKIGDEIGMIGKLINFNKTQVIVVEEFGSRTEIQMAPMFELIWFEKYKEEGEGI